MQETLERGKIYKVIGLLITHTGHIPMRIRVYKAAIHYWIKSSLTVPLKNVC